VRKSNTNTQRIEADSNPITRITAAQSARQSDGHPWSYTLIIGVVYYTPTVVTSTYRYKSGRDLLKELCTSL
jgi:hypothetical protein